MGTETNLLINMILEISFTAIVAAILIIAMIIFPVLFVSFQIKQKKLNQKYAAEKKLMQEALSKLHSGLTRAEAREILSGLKPEENIDEDIYSTTNGEKIFKIQIIYNDDIVTNVNGSDRIVLHE